MPGKYGVSKVSYEWDNRVRWLDMPFPIEEYKERIQRLRKAMVEEGLDGLLLYSCPNDKSAVRWVGNFDSFFGNTIIVLPLEGELVLCTDSVMHSEPMHTQIWTSWIEDVRWAHHPATVRTAENMTDYVRDAVRELGIFGGKLGLVGDRWMPYQVMSDLISGLEGSEIIPATDLFVYTKRVRSPREIEMIKIAALQASRGHEAILNIIKPGMSEYELAAESSRAMLLHGAHEFSFPLALTTGPRAGLKHGYPSARRVKEGDFIFVDLGTSYHGYLSDVGRTFVLGKPDDMQLRMQQTALAMNLSVLETTKPGVRICDVQSACEKIANDANLGEYYFPTGFGHGIATAFAEMPVLFPDNEAIFEAGMTFASEPMIVVEGVGTACYEDIMLVTEKGCVSLSDARRLIYIDIL